MSGQQRTGPSPRPEVGMVHRTSGQMVDGRSITIQNRAPTFTTTATLERAHSIVQEASPQPLDQPHDRVKRRCSVTGHRAGRSTGAMIGTRITTTIVTRVSLSL